MEQKPLTIEELKEMAGQPVWCSDEEAYGVVMCDSIGQWAGIPFLHGVWYHDGIGVEFNHNIIGRKLKCYRVISEKEAVKSPEEKTDESGDSKIDNPEDALEELVRLPAVMIDRPGQRKLDALKYAISAVKKQIGKKLASKTDKFGDFVTICPNCGSAAIYNPFRKGKELYPHCPWCGQKLQEVQDETEKEDQQTE